MNERNLTRIFENYIARFEYMNRPDGMNENYKWYAVRRFQECFDLDAPDFASMLKKACRTTENLIDSSMQHPFSGLVAMAEKYGEAETLRGMFRGLYADDGGDLTARQAKIDAFLASCDALLAKHVPSSHLYKNDQRSAMAYLWFYDPERYSMCKTTEARYLADAVDFYDDWGPYAAFKLDVYERFYQGLIDAMRRNSALMAVHASRFEGHEAEMHPDTNLHILAFDLIYCAKTYGLYENVPVKELSSEEKRLAQQRKEKAAELAERLEAAGQSKLLLQEGLAEAAAMLTSGAAIHHRSFGAGQLESIDGARLVVRFAGFDEPKKLDLAASLGNGFVTLDAPGFSELMNRYGEVLRQAKEIDRRLASAEAALKPYEAYLD